jgi:hypothetical protein
VEETPCVIGDPIRIRRWAGDEDDVEFEDLRANVRGVGILFDPPFRKATGNGPENLNVIGTRTLKDGSLEHPSTPNRAHPIMEIESFRQTYYDSILTRGFKLFGVRFQQISTLGTGKLDLNLICPPIPILR